MNRDHESTCTPQDRTEQVELQTAATQPAQREQQTQPKQPMQPAATFNGAPLTAAPGATIAAALIGSGRQSWRTTRGGAARGLFCGIGVCFDCIVTIDGESGQRACMIPLANGMTITSADA
ncbi:2Fe-2S iron-sulfur cluster protein [Leucobacter luti]|uniref:2Fe-2S iron-sulfur cluster-binding protein n=1 Tax=Leucobacter luti TaxID=340320 RepID=UPI0010D696B8|nr:2Fe-2S iron-sulfur cluster-binding protein [Leucobacter luti]MCW2287190.1 hypothetical protein [Leucobacter luti]TCK41416.1 2Fe-2S iron-sulfur cluster protein [Leucobacter luti]